MANQKQKTQVSLSSATGTQEHPREVRKGSSNVDNQAMELFWLGMPLNNTLPNFSSVIKDTIVSKNESASPESKALLHQKENEDTVTARTSTDEEDDYSSVEKFGKNTTGLCVPNHIQVSKSDEETNEKDDSIEIDDSCDSLEDDRKVATEKSAIQIIGIDDNEEGEEAAKRDNLQGISTLLSKVLSVPEVQRLHGAKINSNHLNIKDSSGHHKMIIILFVLLLLLVSIVFTDINNNNYRKLVIRGIDIDLVLKEELQIFEVSAGDENREVLKDCGRDFDSEGALAPEYRPSKIEDPSITGLDEEQDESRSSSDHHKFAEDGSSIERKEAMNEKNKILKEIMRDEEVLRIEVNEEDLNYLFFDAEDNTQISGDSTTELENIQMQSLPSPEHQIEVADASGVKMENIPTQIQAGLSSKYGIEPGVNPERHTQNQVSSSNEFKDEMTELASAFEYNSKSDSLRIEDSLSAENGCILTHSKRDIHVASEVSLERSSQTHDGTKLELEDEDNLSYSCPENNSKLHYSWVEHNLNAENDNHTSSKISSNVTQPNVPKVGEISLIKESNSQFLSMIFMKKPPFLGPRFVNISSISDQATRDFIQTSCISRSNKAVVIHTFQTWESIFSFKEHRGKIIAHNNAMKGLRALSTSTLD